MQLVLGVLSELDLPADVEHVTDPGEIVRLGVFSLPALLINGEVKIVGSLPRRETLRQWLAALKPPPA